MRKSYFKSFSSCQTKTTLKFTLKEHWKISSAAFFFCDNDFQSIAVIFQCNFQRQILILFSKILMVHNHMVITLFYFPDWVVSLYTLSSVVLYKLLLFQLGLRPMPGGAAELYPWNYLKHRMKNDPMVGSSWWRDENIYYYMLRGKPSLYEKQGCQWASFPSIMIMSKKLNEW